MPAILYGGATPVNVTVDPKDVLPPHPRPRGRHPAAPGDASASRPTRMAIIRDMQFDPVTENLLHVDLQEVAMDKPIQVTVPLRHVGEAIGVKDAKGILEMILREVQVSCLPASIPESFDRGRVRAGHPRRASRSASSWRPRACASSTTPARPSPRWRRPWPRKWRWRRWPRGRGHGGRARGAHRAEAQGRRAADEKEKDTEEEVGGPGHRRAGESRARSTGTRGTTWASAWWTRLARTLHARFERDGGHLVGPARWHGEPVYLIKPQSLHERDRPRGGPRWPGGCTWAPPTSSSSSTTSTSRSARSACG